MKVLCLFFFVMSGGVFANFVKKTAEEETKQELLKELKHSLKKTEMSEMKAKLLRYGGKSIGALIEVMKNGNYPEGNRWMATFMVGRIMGKQAGPFLVKFLKHPEWMMRMASLKTLLALKEKRFFAAYGKSLSDQSLLVRKQALENIRRLSLTQVAPMVWAMLYDEKNYYGDGKNREQGIHLIKDIIKTVGDLKFSRAEAPLLSMIQKRKYAYVFGEIDYALEKITGKKTPKGSVVSKKRFWRRFAMAQKNI